MMRVLVVAAFLALSAAPAGAFQCPSDVAAIDAALATASGMSAESKAKVMALRDKGEQAHKSGRHQEAVDTLAEAKKLLGIN